MDATLLARSPSGRSLPDFPHLLRRADSAAAWAPGAIEVRLAGTSPPAARHVAWRAALIARDHQAPLRMLHPAMPAWSAQLMLDIRDRLGLHVQLQSSGNAARSGRLPGLAVMGVDAMRWTQLRLRHAMSEILDRQQPVLVVKRPAFTSYRRVLTAVDFAPHAGAVLSHAGALSRDPRMKVVHVQPPEDHVSMRWAGNLTAMRRVQRSELTRRALGQIDALIAQAGAEGGGMRPVVGFGDPAAAILHQAEAHRAELIVVGNSSRHWISGWLVGDTLGRVLHRSRADVLVVPAGRAS